MTGAITIVLLLVAADAAVAAEAPDVDAARTLLAEAQLALEGHEAARAASLFDAAHALSPHPLWRLAAAEAWVAAAEPERALERLAAIGDAPIGDAARDKRVALTQVARTLAPIVTRARRQTLDQAHADAAASWAEAFAVLPIGRLRLEEARALLRAKRRHEAERRFDELTRRVDLSRAEQRDVAESLARLHAADLTPAPAPASRAPAWMLVGGGALVLGGVITLVVADGQRADVRDAMALDPEARTMTRADALALADEADTLDAAGFITGGIGLALAGTGALLGTAGGLGFRF